MNLTGRPVYQKQGRANKRPTPKQRDRWAKLVEHGCIICRDSASIHHCETGGGGRKNHDKVLPLCYFHHQGEEGIHTLGRKKWQARYGSEQELMEKLVRLLDTRL